MHCGPPARCCGNPCLSLDGLNGGWGLDCQGLPLGNNRKPPVVRTRQKRVHPPPRLFPIRLGAALKFQPTGEGTDQVGRAKGCHEFVVVLGYPTYYGTIPGAMKVVRIRAMKSVRPRAGSASVI